MLHELAEPKGLPYEAELVLRSSPWCDFGGRAVETVEIPGVETGKVLESAHELVATDYAIPLVHASFINMITAFSRRVTAAASWERLTSGRDKLEVVCHSRMVNHHVGDHFGRSRANR